MPNAKGDGAIVSNPAEEIRVRESAALDILAESPETAIALLNDGPQKRKLKAQAQAIKAARDAFG